MYHDRYGELERVEAIDYWDGAPHSVRTQRSGYDFEHSRTYGSLHFRDGDDPALVYCHEMGGMNGKQLWLANGVDAETYVNGLGRDYRRRSVPRAELVWMGYEMLNRPLELAQFAVDGEPTCNPFDVAEEGSVEYCQVCEDNFPESSECDHLVWVDGHGMCGCGTTDITEDKYRKSVHAIVRKSGMGSELVEHLRGKDLGWRQLWVELGVDELYPRIEDLDDEYQLGMAWLSSLDREMARAATDKMLEWIGLASPSSEVRTVGAVSDE